MITTINFILCVIILLFGIWLYVRKKYDVPLYIGIAFGLFGVSHLLTILGLAAGVASLLIAVRILAYLLVVFALYRIMVAMK
jgi:hypothetical protein